MIRKLRGRSLSELRDRIAQAGRALAERRGFLPVAVLPDRLNVRPSTPWQPPDASRLRARVTASDRQAIIDAADRVLVNRFDLLGFTGLDYGSPVRWQFDPISGREAPLRHWSRVPYLDHERVGDHKVTWELNRHQWLIRLGQAWLLTGDSRVRGKSRRTPP